MVIRCMAKTLIWRNVGLRPIGSRLRCWCPLCDSAIGQTLRAWRNGRRTGLDRKVSASGETQGVELPKFGETFTGNPEPSPVTGRCRD